MKKSEKDSCDKCTKPFGGDGDWPSNIDGKEVDICHHCWLGECCESFWSMWERKKNVVK